MPITFTFDPGPQDEVTIGSAWPTEPVEQPSWIMTTTGSGEHIGGTYVAQESREDLSARDPRLQEDAQVADAEVAAPLAEAVVARAAPEDESAGDEGVVVVDDDLPLAALITHTHLRQARLTAGLSQVALATRAGVTQGYITQIETGRRRPTERVVAAYRAVGEGDKL